MHTKLRKLVVISSHSKHVLAIPLYTHAGVGITKVQDRIEEFCEIKEVGVSEQRYDGIYPPIYMTRSADSRIDSGNVSRNTVSICRTRMWVWKNSL